MAKAQNPKPLIPAKPEKGKKLKKIEKKTTAAKPKSVKPTKQKLIQESVKESKSLLKNAKSTSVKQPKKDVEDDSKIKISSSSKRFVLAPPESPAPKQPEKLKKASVKSTKKDTKAKGEKDSSAAGVSKVPLKVKNKKETQEKKGLFGKNQKNKKLLLKKSASGSRRVSSKKPVEKDYEPVAVDEATFDGIVNIENIMKITEALKKLVEKELDTKKTSIFGDYNYCLNVSGFKIASCPKRMVKLNLKHSIVDPKTDDVVIVVPDLKRGAKVEFESTIEHYTDLFQEAGVEGLKIMPFNQLRNEFKSFESKRKLAGTYDYYMCDGRISGQIVGFCGKTFQKPRTIFHTVRMENPKNLKNEIDKALRRTAYKQLSRGDLITIPVGSDKFSSKKLAENIVHVVGQLKTLYPGGLDNIRGIDIKVNIKGTSSLPIYVSTASGPDEVPFVLGPREDRMLKLKKQTNETLSKFLLTKDAEIVKLTPAQAEKKRKFREDRSALLKEQNKTEEAENPEESAEVVKPVKKAKIEENVVEKKVKKKSVTKKEKVA